MSFNEIELIARQIGFETRLVKDLSENCLLRLQHWLIYLQVNHDQVVSHTSEGTFHAWNASLSILLEHIGSGDIHFSQYLFSKPSNSHNYVPLPDSQRCCGSRNAD